MVRCRFGCWVLGWLGRVVGFGGWIGDGLGVGCWGVGCWGVGCRGVGSGVGWLGWVFGGWRGCWVVGKLFASSL